MKIKNSEILWDADTEMYIITKYKRKGKRRRGVTKFVKVVSAYELKDLTYEDAILLRDLYEAQFKKDS